MNNQQLGTLVHVTAQTVRAGGTKADAIQALAAKDFAPFKGKDHKQRGECYTQAVQSYRSFVKDRIQTVSLQIVDILTANGHDVNIDNVAEFDFQSVAEAFCATDESQAAWAKMQELRDKIRRDNRYLDALAFRRGATSKDLSAVDSYLTNLLDSFDLVEDDSADDGADDGADTGAE